MGTEATVSITVQNETIALRIAEDAFTTMTAYENRFSRFLPTSELSHLNAVKHMAVSEEFLSVLAESYRLYNDTHHAFNPLVQIKHLGYRTSFRAMGHHDVYRIEQTPYNTDFSSVCIDEKTQAVTLQYNQELDFGGILKGYLATKLAKLLTQKYPACIGLIVNIGGDLHTVGLDKRGEPFIFYLYNPVTDIEIPIPLTDTSLVTSGTYKRRWNTVDGEKHHILDPATHKNPETDIISVSVIHPDGATAEAYATMLMVKGLTETQKLIESPPMSYFIVKTDGTILTNIP